MPRWKVKKFGKVYLNHSKKGNKRGKNLEHLYTSQSQKSTILLSSLNCYKVVYARTVKGLIT